MAYFLISFLWATESGNILAYFGFSRRCFDIHLLLEHFCGPFPGSGNSVFLVLFSIISFWFVGIYGFLFISEVLGNFLVAIWTDGYGYYKDKNHGL